jgi:hypothetical protein
VVVAMVHLAKVFQQLMVQMAFRTQVAEVVVQFTVLQLLQHSQRDEKVEAVVEWLLFDIKTQGQHLLLTCLLEQVTAIGNVPQELTLLNYY